ncbi:hypothetical protein DFJ74DRAFT_764347 [Hyaloraphidium curvatum]|nr:hypothetical protein DFJ74DRAFT_764347 [Hyaloraphidium curvatum]
MCAAWLLLRGPPPGAPAAEFPRMRRAWAAAPCEPPLRFDGVCIATPRGRPVAPPPDAVSTRPRTVFPREAPPPWGARNPSFARLCGEMGGRGPIGPFFEFAGAAPAADRGAAPEMLPALAVAEATVLQNAFHTMLAAVALHSTVRELLPGTPLPAAPRDLRVHMLNRVQGALRGNWFGQMSFLFSAVVRDPQKNILVDEQFSNKTGIRRFVPPHVPAAPACFARSVWGVFLTMRKWNTRFPADFVAYRNAMLVAHYRSLVFGDGPFPAHLFPPGRVALHPTFRTPFRLLPGPPASLPADTPFDSPPLSPFSPPFRYPCHRSLIPLLLVLRTGRSTDRNLTNPDQALRWISELNPELERLHGARVVPALASFDAPHPPAEQLRAAFRTRILAGVHGAGLSWGLFLPPGSVLLEISVPRLMKIQRPEWKPGDPVKGWSVAGDEAFWFGQLAEGTGSRHYRTGMYASRDGSVTLEKEDWDEAVREAVGHVVREERLYC